MPEYLDLQFEKFTFRVALDRLYTAEGVWAKQEGAQVRIGLSDFLQQRSGDMAFVETKPAGTRLSFGDEVVVIETIKVDISLGSPAGGEIVATNPDLGTTPEVINQDPYGEGWLVLVATDQWEADRARLMDGYAYYQLIGKQAEEESR